MKLFLFLLCVSLPCFGTDAPKPLPLADQIKKEESPRYQPIQAADGHVAATFDTKEKKVSFVDDPKDVVLMLLGYMNNLNAACVKALGEKDALLAKKDEKPKK